MITNQIIKNTYNVYSVNQFVLYILLRYSVPRNIYIYILYYSTPQGLKDKNCIFNNNFD